MKIRNLLNRLRTPAIYYGLLMLVAACTDESEVSPIDREQDETLVSFRLASRGSSVDADKDINTLRVIAFDSRNGALVFNRRLDFSGNPVKVEMLSGKRDFYVISNEPSGMMGVLDNIMSYNDLRAVRIPATSLHDGGAFVAFGSKAAQTIVPKVNNNEVTIDDMKRLATKIDLTLRGKNFSEPVAVTLSNLPDAVPLLEDIAYDPSAVGTVRITTFTDAAPESGYIWTKTVDGIIIPSYKPTSMIADNAVKINVTLENNRTVSGKIGHKVSDSNYALQRNTIYGLVANVDADQLSIVTTIANWDRINQDYPAGGGSFWMTEPQSVRVGLDGTLAERTATFTAKFATNAEFVYKWYRKRQLNDMSYVTEELASGMDGVTISLQADNSSQLTIITSKLEDSGEIYVVGVTTSPDGRTETLESSHSTLMVVGTEIDDAGIYPDMQNWTPPRNALFGATCLLRDHRVDGAGNNSENNKVYRVKLMADGNWWMIQDLAYGEKGLQDAFGEDPFYQYHTDYEYMPPTKVGNNTYYGAAMKNKPPTGGYLYNIHASFQFTEVLPNDKDYDYEGHANTVTLLPSLCPEGWHLPGNLNGRLNDEWLRFYENIPNLSIEKFGYNSASEFNAYTFENNWNGYVFCGGYFSEKERPTKTVSYWALGICGNNSNIDPGETKSDRIATDTALSIRCVRNYPN